MFINILFIIFYILSYITYIEDIKNLAERQLFNDKFLNIIIFR
jgi:hypothetical protein